MVKKPQSNTAFFTIGVLIGEKSFPFFAKQFDICRKNNSGMYCLTSTYSICYQKVQHEEVLHYYLTTLKNM